MNMSQPSWIGYTLSGRYKIDQMIGQGGMSTVYRASDPNLRRVVAVKLIHSHLSNNAEFVRRFEEEAAAVAQLRHNNIIQVFDFNHDGETYYMVLEYVEGETLQQRLRNLRQEGLVMPVNEVVHIGAGLADAIDYAHRRGMIHRDIKPANVMLDKDGRAVLMDFGIAKMLGGEQHTATGAVVGTALYMSPEQVTGQRPSTQSDIYSLGVTLFEMVGGRPPFEGDSAMSVMMMHVNDPVPDIAAINPSTPASVKRIIETALSKDPADRQASAADVAHALRSADLATPASTGSAASTQRMGKVPRQTGEETFIEAAVTPPPSRPAAPIYAAPAVPSPVPVEPPAVAPRGKRGGPSMALIGGGAGLLLLLALCTVIGVLVVMPMLSNPGGTAAGDPTATTESDATLAGSSDSTQVSEVTEAATEVPTEAFTDTPSGPPTETPTPTITPTATVPSEPFVRINSITLDGSTYVVEYETFGYTESLSGSDSMHVHFFFNTVTPEQAGSPGSGPWELYGGPRPFRKYTTSHKPGAATQMCALVARHNHSIILNSGNCVDLPSS